MSAAMDAIRDLFHVERFDLMGQSGGGGIVAAMVNERHDIRCAVAGAAKGSYYSDGPDYNLYSYDPIRELRRANPQADLRLFVVSDPDDALAGGRMPALRHRRGQLLNVAMMWFVQTTRNITMPCPIPL